ncbi:GNAT family N-acetyltransferase [Halobacillus litoralis]|uniref:GNAT family N-acetyltransferase n=1 Tax=Halobacillus litoralis TaxID=45668 RepID=UPI001CFD3B8A|nr:GNAT family N-acetyltransferase [Halobacillus litoralis]
MYFKFAPINMEYVIEIDSWNYEGFIEEVGMKPYFESYRNTKSLKGPGGCEGFVALLDQEAAGLFEFNINESAMEIGLALRPDLVGKGLGAKYVQQGIDFGLHYYPTNVEVIHLVVDSKNKAAIRVYEKIGFKRRKQNDNEIEMTMRISK